MFTISMEQEYIDNILPTLAQQIYSFGDMKLFDRVQHRWSSGSVWDPTPDRLENCDSALVSLPMNMHECI